MPSPMSASLKGTISSLAAARALLMARDPPAWTAHASPTVRWGGNLLQAKSACAGAVGPALVRFPCALPLHTLTLAARRSTRVVWATVRRASVVALPRRCSMAAQTLEKRPQKMQVNSLLFAAWPVVIFKSCRKRELALSWREARDAGPARLESPQFGRAQVAIVACGSRHSLWKMQAKQLYNFGKGTNRRLGRRRLELRWRQDRHGRLRK
jgi:hypothetical protein